jgi:hypothetical protein
MISLLDIYYSYYFRYTILIKRNKKHMYYLYKYKNYDSFFFIFILFFASFSYIYIFLITLRFSFYPSFRSCRYIAHRKKKRIQDLTSTIQRSFSGRS